VWPFRDAPNVVVFHRIEVNVIDMGREVIVVADHVLPVTALPDASLAAAGAGLGSPLAAGQGAGEDRLDQPPAGRKIVVAGWQRPDAVEVIGKHHPGVDGERAAAAGDANRLAQSVNVANEEVVAAPLEQVDGEEIASAFDAMATVVGNGASAPVGFHQAHSFGGSRFALDPPYRVRLTPSTAVDSVRFR
jgi:hypothetical protein